MLRPFRGVWSDVRLAARRLLATPLFLLFAVVSLALGVGVTTAVYSVVETILWGPLGIADAERVVAVTVPGRSGDMRAWRSVVSRPDFDDLRTGSSSFQTLSASSLFHGTLVTAGTSETVVGEAVTGDYFQTLGVTAAVGRTLQLGDVDPPAPVVVIAHRYWRTALGADPRVVGQTVRLRGIPLEVVGVAAEGFHGLRNPSDPSVGTIVWVPLLPSGDRGRRDLSIVGRLRPGRTALAAGAEVAMISARLDEAVPMRANDTATGTVAGPRKWTATPISVATATPGISRMGMLITGSVGLVLLVACTNLANLMLARGTLRQHEIAVRRALGASRWRLVREQCAESVLIAGLGGMAAFAVTRGLLILFTLDLPVAQGRIIRIEPQLSVFALAVAAAALLLSLVVFGVEPALQLTRRSLRGDLDSGAGNVGAARPSRQRALLRWQVAICTAFFLVAAILAKVVVAEARHDPGIDLGRLAIASVHFKLQGWDEARARLAIERALEAARNAPDIETVAVSSGVPFGATLTPFAPLTTPDKPFVKGSLTNSGYLLAATPEVFSTFGVPIVHGRRFDMRDGAATQPVMVVSEFAAKELFGNADAIGRDVMMQAWGIPPTKTFTVVGVARDTDTGRMFSRRSALVYVPLAQHYEPNLMFVAKARTTPDAAVRALQGAIRSADTALGTGTVGSARMLLTGLYVVARIAAVLAAALGALTLLLSMVGLYGVQSHIVAHRTREVGVRLALGASAQQIERMVLREGLRPVLEGLALGLALGVAARLLVRAVLVAPIQIVDPVAFSLVPIPLVAAAFLACYLPARRAARVDPNVALRHL